MVFGHKKVSKRRICELLKVPRSNVYYKTQKSEESVLEAKITDIYLEQPSLGYRQIHDHLLDEHGYQHNVKKTHRIAKKLGLRAVCPKKKKQYESNPSYVKPYLLKDMTIEKPNQVWQTDITYIKISCGTAYLSCIIDVCSRKIMGWALSPFIDKNLCLNTLNNALESWKPEILNSDQGSQYTSKAWQEALQHYGIEISMNGKGRCADNIYIERFWRTIKYEFIFLHSFTTVAQLRHGIADYIKIYNTRRRHQSLGRRTPEQVFNNYQREVNGLGNKNFKDCIVLEQ